MSVTPVPPAMHGRAELALAAPRAKTSTRMTSRRGLPRVTILTANAGGGHRAASRSLSEALEGKAFVTQVSMIDDHAPFPLNTWSATYAPWVNYTPWLYRMVY